MKVLCDIVVTSDKFNQTIQNILSKPEYKGLKNVFADFLEKLKSSLSSYLLNKLKSLFSNISSAKSATNKLSIIFIIIGILVIVAIIILIMVKLSKTFEKKLKISEILGEEISSKTTPKSLRLESSKFALRGEYREAIHLDFIALLLLMYLKNILYLDETKTNEEIYKYLKNNKFKEIMDFKSLSDTFNSSWYGHKSSEINEYNIWNERLNLIWNEVIINEGKDK